MNYLLITIILVFLCTFSLNLLFGYWRASVRKFSLKWFLTIHIPVPIVIALRFISQLGFQIYTYPIFVGAFFLGQYIGGMAYKKLQR